MLATKKTTYLLLIIGLLFSCSIEEFEPLTPVNISATPFSPISIAENPENGMVLGTIEANATLNKGGNGNAKFSFSLTNQNPEGAMSIDEKTGVLTILDASKFDYESAPVVSALAEIDLDGVVEGVDISISLTDRHEVSLTGFTTSIDENLPVGFKIGSVTAEFEDGTATFSLLSQIPEGTFSIDSETGDVFIADSSKVDYETNPQITATAQVSNKGEIKTAEITVKLQDVIEPNPDVDAIAYYKLNGDIADEKQGTQGVINNAMAVSGVDGMSNTAYEVNRNEFIAIDAPIIDITQDFSIAIWAKPNQPNPYTAENTIWSNRRDVNNGSDQGGMSLIYLNDGTTEKLRLRAYVVRSTGVFYVVGHDVEIDFSDKGWHHITVTKSGNDYSIYTDGELLCSFTDTSTVYNGTSWTLGGLPYRSGSNILTWRNFDGAVDQLRFYQKVVTEEEIGAMFSYKI